jgi:methionyl aminopeptidase
MGIKIKTPEEIQIMVEGGKKLARVKKALAEAVSVGVSSLDIENLAVKLIKEEGAEGSFNKVPGYSWVTCISVNEGLVHGIPSKDVVFKDGDIVSIDVGLYFGGFHTDTSITVGINPSSENKKFLNVGIMALQKAISKAMVGNYVFDISEAIESTVEAHGYATIKALVGHGVGKDLHEDPQIPCFVPALARGRTGRITDSPKIAEGMVLAIEVMYAAGSDKVQVLEDGWTIAMRDGKMSGLFEESVAVTKDGPIVLTR